MFGKGKKNQKKDDESTRDWGERAAEALVTADRAIVQNPVSQQQRDSIQLRGD